jgi:hypothetical protein
MRNGEPEAYFIRQIFMYLCRIRLNSSQPSSRGAEGAAAIQKQHPYPEPWIASLRSQGRELINEIPYYISRRMPLMETRSCRTGSDICSRWPRFSMRAPRGLRLQTLKQSSKRPVLPVR